MDMGAGVVCSAAASAGRGSTKDANQSRRCWGGPRGSVRMRHCTVQCTPPSSSHFSAAAHQKSRIRDRACRVLSRFLELFFFLSTAQVLSSEIRALATSEQIQPTHDAVIRPGTPLRQSVSARSGRGGIVAQQDSFAWERAMDGERAVWHWDRGRGHHIYFVCPREPAVLLHTQTQLIGAAACCRDGREAAGVRAREPVRREPQQENYLLSSARGPWDSDARGAGGSDSGGFCTH
ncbi:hypothetical protein B0T25DRAFT_324993 [Lasiosphaeria hispida]|uniref:Uncharacterized protein n=1 Tax=Lasiosphaeria hispida TaxID=260671 RepID=A0AAJ0H9P8_9PEZI|nr:hypothetical protein B0T25DRAFT_324993 [Lasiosphaeria hispida]